jgi:hypothetical protein
LYTETGAVESIDEQSEVACPHSSLYKIPTPRRMDNWNINVVKMILKTLCNQPMSEQQVQTMYQQDSRLNSSLSPYLFVPETTIQKSDELRLKLFKL